MESNRQERFFRADTVWQESETSPQKRSMDAVEEHIRRTRIRFVQDPSATRRRIRSLLRSMAKIIRVINTITEITTIVLLMPWWNK